VIEEDVHVVVAEVTVTGGTRIEPSPDRW
jgi:hypothetical protein